MIESKNLEHFFQSKIRKYSTILDLISVQYTVSSYCLPLSTTKTFQL